MPKSKKGFSNLPPDWRLEPPPEGDWRFLGHPSHDARGFLKKANQFAPWVLHCICGKTHELPAKPGMAVGTNIMVHAIDGKSAHADLNGFGGKVCGPPDADGAYPVKITMSGETVLLPDVMLKTQVFGHMGTMYDGRMTFNSRAVRDEKGNVVLPPLPPPKPKPPKPKPKPRLGLFLRNFQGFFKDGFPCERYQWHGPRAMWFPATGVERPASLFWSEAAGHVLGVGLSKQDPYLSKWPLGMLKQLVSWNDGDTEQDHGLWDEGATMWSTAGDSLPSVWTDDSHTGGGGGGGGWRFGDGGVPGKAAATAAKAAKKAKWSSKHPDGEESPNSERRTLTLVLVKDPDDAMAWAAKLDPPEPLYVHLRQG